MKDTTRDVVAANITILVNYLRETAVKFILFFNKKIEMTITRSEATTDFASIFYGSALPFLATQSGTIFLYHIVKSLEQRKKSYFKVSIQDLREEGFG